jgi:hypothetical protein
MSAAPKSSITGIENDLTFSKKDVYLWVKLSDTHYEFKTDDDRERIVTDFTLALANILDSDENELECHLIVTSTLFDNNKWQQNFRRAVAKDRPTSYLNEYTSKMAEHIAEYQFRDKNVYLGVNLGPRNSYNAKKSALKIPFLDDIFNSISGEVDEYISQEELDFWENKARLVRFSLLDGEIQANPVTSSEIAYTVRKNFFPAMPMPSTEDLDITGSQSWGAGELQTLNDSDIINTPRWLEITQLIDGMETKGYRATLCMAKFPEVMNYPEKEPWIHSASLLGFPIDIYSRFSIIPSAKVKKQVGNRIKEIKDQAANMTSAGGQINLEVEENLRLGQYLDYALTKNDTPWLYGRHRVVVEASSENELKERCQAVIEHYKSLDILVVWSTGDQLSLLQESMPNDKIRLSSYYQRHELSIMGAGVPAGTGGAGDMVLRNDRGEDQGWLSNYIGYTTSRIVEPVFLSMHSALARNRPPGLVITGAPGSGKSYTAFTLTYGMVVSGVKTIYIDPKVDALPLASLPGCEDTTIIDLQQSPDGLLDPFQIGESDGERIDLVANTIEMLVGGRSQISSTASSELSKAIKIVLKNRTPSLNQLVEILLSSKTPDANALGERLSLIKQMPFARLCFAERKRDSTSPTEGLNLDSRLTILTLLGLDMPNASTPKEDYSHRNYLAVAILFLLTSFARKLMINPKAEDKHRPKAIVIDEAWAITSTAQGSKMVMEIARMGRSLNTAIILVSQNAGDFLGESVTNSVSTKMAFKAEDAGEITNVLNFFQLPDNRGNREVVSRLKTGQCLLKDAEGRIARVQIDGWDAQQRIAFETNPIAKRRNEEEANTLGF